MTANRPTLNELGRDLLSIHPIQPVISLTLLWLSLMLYFVSATQSLWLISILAIMIFSFYTYPSVSHDLVHQTWGLNSTFNFALLSVIEGLAFRSGTAYRLSHLHHHQRFPHRDDIEGRAAFSNPIGALLQGPGYIPSLWWWSWQTKPAFKKLLLIELIWIGSFLSFCLISLHWTPVFAFYAFLNICGVWLFPLFLSYIQHVPEGKNELFQTRVYRGLFFSGVFLRQNYHLAHHLYPGISHYNWTKLGKRLEPFYRKYGVKPITFTSLINELMNK